LPTGTAHKIHTARDRARIRVRAVKFWILKTDKGPIIVEPHEIETLRTREAAGEFDFLKKGAVIRIAIGSVVLVAQGPFEGKRGVIAAQLRDDRYRVGLNNFSVLGYCRSAPD
jgi:hypothetical protein